MTHDISRVELSLTVSALVAATCLLYALPRRTRSLPLPPGPQADPLIGHLRKLPTSDEHRVYAQWSKELNSACPVCD
jgi:hypothetical protein